LAAPAIKTLPIAAADPPTGPAAPPLPNCAAPVPAYSADAQIVCCVDGRILRKPARLKKENQMSLNFRPDFQIKI
jgi:hypothetical protein